MPECQEGDTGLSKCWNHEAKPAEMGTAGTGDLVGGMERKGSNQQGGSKEEGGKG